ncbi:MAG TPA: hypothetical protein PLX89_22585 [Verrucomicrobiota bacterium]|nr:hypothetical protein [Verrucomicrobiales bacterium]HRI15794.1 hypothetical protein [Verrucomicrobiota bacterium]
MTESTVKIPAPYPGLRPFDAADAAIFFGREIQVDAMLRKLEDHRFLAVVGTSGSGKSSLVRAGLIPAIREGFLCGVTDWVAPVIRPGFRPFDRLAEALLVERNRAEGEQIGKSELVTDAKIERGLTVAALRRGSQGLAEAIHELGFPESTHVLLVVDQFEEIFAFRRRGPTPDQTGGRDEAAAFVNLLLGAVAVANRPIWVLLTMRSDFIGDCEAFLGLPELVSNSQFLVPRLDRGQMEEVITGPGRLSDVAYAPFTFEPGLVNRLINDAGDRPDQLPLMQHALMRTWMFARDRVAAEGTGNFCITFADYESAGGIDRALSDHAEKAWGELRNDDRTRRLARHLFLLLCEVSLDGQITRRRPPVSEVMHVSGASIADIETVVRVFQRDERNFIVTSPAEGFTEETRLDISHEALLRQWGRLSGGDGWLAQEQAAAVELRRLVASANLYNQGKGDLLFARDLNRVRDWHERVEPNSNWAHRYVTSAEWSAAKRFVLLSHQAQERAQQQEAERARTRRNLILGFSTAMGVIAVVAICLAAFALKAKRAAAEAAIQRRAQALAAESWQFRERDPVLSLLLATAAVEITRPQDSNQPVALLAQRTLRESLAEVSGIPVLSSLAITPSADKRWATSEDADRTITLWDLSQPAKEETLHPERLSGFRLSPDDNVTAVAVSPDRRHVVAGGKNGVVRLWHRGTDGLLQPPVLLRGHSNWITALAISPDNRWLITTSADQATNATAALLWDLQLTNVAQRSIPLKGHTGIVYSATISPDGTWGITGGDDGTARLWNLRTSDPSQNSKVLTGHNSAVYALAVSTNSNWLVTGSWDRTARQWDLRAPNPSSNSVVLGGENGHVMAVISVALSPDGRWAVTGSDDKTARVWDLNALNPSANPKVLAGHKSRITTVAVSPDSQWIITGSHDKTAGRWAIKDVIRSKSPAERALDPESPDNSAKPLLLEGHKSPVVSVSVSPDGEWIATASSKAVILWPLSPETQESARAQPAALKGHELAVHATIISPDGRWIITGSEDNTARLWEIGTNGPTGQSVVLPGHANHVSHLAVSPDGRWLVTGTEDKTARLWDLRNIRQGRLPQAQILGGSGGHTAAVTATAISPNNRWVATGSSDGKVRLWDLQSANMSAAPIVLAGHTNGITSLAFSTNGHWLLSGSVDTTARLWRLTPNPSTNAVVLGGHEKEVRVVAISPDNRWAIAGGADNSVSLWDLSKAHPETNRIVLKGHNGPINALAVDRDSQWVVTGSDDNTARQWYLASANKEGGFRAFVEHLGSVVALALSPDGQWLMTGSSDGNAGLWDLHSLDPAYRPFVLAGRAGEVHAVAITPDSRWAVTGNSNGPVALWSLKTPDLLKLAQRYGGRNLSTNEWIRSLGTNEPYFKVFEALPNPPE